MSGKMPAKRTDHAMSDFDTFCSATWIKIELRLDGATGSCRVAAIYKKPGEKPGGCEFDHPLDKTSRIADFLDWIMPEISRALRYRTMKRHGRNHD